MHTCHILLPGKVGEVAVEQRLYAHWTRPHLLVQEFALKNGGGKDTACADFSTATVAKTTPFLAVLRHRGDGFVHSRRKRVGLDR